MNKSSDDWNKLKHLVDLSAENASLKAEVERLRASSFVTAVPVEEYEKLKAKVERLKMEESKLLTLCETYEGDLERLRKAGDAMAKRTEFFQKRWDADELCQEVEAWNAAKEGK